MSKLDHEPSVIGEAVNELSIQTHENQNNFINGSTSNAANNHSNKYVSPMCFEE